MSLSPMHISIKEITQAAFKAMQGKMATLGKVKGEGEFEVIATTDSVDREGEILLSDGWDFKNYLKNPVVLWGHQWESMPIGAVTEIDTSQQGKIIMKGVFAPTAAGQEVRKLYDSGILRTVSVGYIVKERQGPVISKKEMAELTFCAIPANPDALSTHEVKALKSIDKLVKDEEKTPEEEVTKDDVKSPDKVQVEAEKITLPKESDSVEAQAKGIGTKAGRVLSAKSISVIEEVLAKKAVLQSGLDELDKMLRGLVEEATAQKNFLDEAERKAVQERIRKRLQQSDSLVGEALREWKLLT